MKSKNGFTLLEVLIAIGIFGVFLGSISLIQSRALDASVISEETNTAVMLARKKMSEIEAFSLVREFNELDKVKEGTWKKPFDRFSWKQELREVKIPQFLFQSSEEVSPKSPETLVFKTLSGHITKSVRELTLEVRWESFLGEELISITTLLVKPHEEIDLPF